MSPPPGKNFFQIFLILGKNSGFFPYPGKYTNFPVVFSRYPETPRACSGRTSLLARLSRKHPNPICANPGNSQVFALFSRYFPFVFPICSRYFPDIFPLCSRYFPDIFPMFSHTCVLSRKHPTPMCAYPENY